jgi:hypothetical protein
VLVRVVEFELETQDVFDLTHSDPSGIGHVGFQQKLARLPASVGKNMRSSCTLLDRFCDAVMLWRASVTAS